MDTYQEEEIQRLKEWWRENGTSLIIGLTIGISSVIGWRFWESHTAEQEAKASDVFQTILAEAEEGEISDDLAQSADVIRTSYTNTFYAALSDLAEVRLDTEKGKFATAQQHLRDLIKDMDDEALREVAKLRLARHLVATRSLDEAEQLLSTVAKENETAPHWELHGDLMVLRGRKEEAVDFYRRAWREKDNEDRPQASPFLETKLQNLGRKPEEDEATTAS